MLVLSLKRGYCFALFFLFAFFCTLFSFFSSINRVSRMSADRFQTVWSRYEAFECQTGYRLSGLMVCTPTIFFCRIARRQWSNPTKQLTTAWWVVRKTALRYVVIPSICSRIHFKQTRPYFFFHWAVPWMFYCLIWDGRDDWNPGSWHENNTSRLCSRN